MATAIEEVTGMTNGAELLAHAETVPSTVNAETEPTASDDRSELDTVVGDYRVTIVHNGRAVKAETLRYPTTGKANDWDPVLLAMLAQPKGAELLVKPNVVVNKSTGVPSPRYPMTQIRAAQLRMLPHHVTRIKVERLSATVSVDGATTYGALLVTVTPANKR